MTLRYDDYDLHFNEEDLIYWMFLNEYDNITIKSPYNGFYYNIQIDGFDDMYNDYWFEYVEHVPDPTKEDIIYAKEYDDYLKNNRGEVK